MRDPDLRSVLIELEAADTARNDHLVGLLEAAGLYMVHRSASRQGDIVNGIFARRGVSVAVEPAAAHREA